MLISEKTQKIKEKEEIKSMSNHIGLSLLGYFLIMMGWSFIYLKFALLFGFSEDTALKFSDDPMGENVIQAIVSMIMVLLPALILCRTELKKVRDSISFSKPKGKTLSIFGAALGFCYFVSLAEDTASSIFEGFGITAPSVSLQNPKGVSGFLMSVLVTAFLPALIEEFAMRGVALGLLRRFGDGFAIIGSAAIFGLMHASASQIPFAAFVGLALGIVAVKTESIWLCTAIHFANNFLYVVLSYMSEYLSEEAVVFADLILDVLLLALFILCAVNISKKDDAFLTLEKANTKSTEKEKLIGFFTAPALIISAVISLAIAFFLR